MYMCRLRHINDPVLSSLKMEGIRLLFFISPKVTTALKGRFKDISDTVRNMKFNVVPLDEFSA
jgi:hypothetical protein